MYKITPFIGQVVFSHLTDQQIQNPENQQFSDYVDIDAHETDYDNPKLALDTGDVMEMGYAKKTS